MELALTSLHPSVFKSFSKEKIYLSFSKEINKDLLCVRIMPMERHTVLHKEHRLDEEQRYPLCSIFKDEKGFYTEYEFANEQQYSVSIEYNGEVVTRTHIYAVDSDLSVLKCFKGDTHLHTCRSDGTGTPFEVATGYRAQGFDFICVTDHHKFEPSLEAKAEIEPLTDVYKVFSGEEVHNKNMGSIHIVNFGGEKSVNELIENNPEYVENQIQEIIKERNLSTLFDPYTAAFRIFVAGQIRKAGGVAILAHPFWEAYGEYNMPVEEAELLLSADDYDAVEILGSCDNFDHGNNLVEMLKNELALKGKDLSVVGSSDAHVLKNGGWCQHFDVNFTLVFAKDFDDIKTAIKDKRSVAVEKHDDKNFRAIGKFRLVKYVRFLMRDYFPRYKTLTALHAEAIRSKDNVQIAKAEEKIKEFNKRFFAF